MDAISKLTSTPEGRKLYYRERTILELTELICEVMQERNVSNTELAKRLNRGEDWLLRILRGGNTTMHDIFNIFFALGEQVHFASEAISDRQE